MKRTLVALATGLLTSFLAGCGSADDPAWVDYHRTLTRALDAEPIERRDPDNIGAFVAQRERLIDIIDVRESMLNVYALRECDITSLVAARNNQLGRVAPPSQHWLYERELWQRLERCAGNGVTDSLSEADQTRLKTLTELKTAQLPSVGWNALFDSEEWEKSFSRASQPLELRALPDMTQAFEALGYLTTMVENTYSLEWQADSATLENHLKTLQERPLTAEVLRTLQLGSQRLTEANRLLAENVGRGHCLPPWDQAWLDRAARASQHWLGAINTLIDAHDVTPPQAVAAYQQRWLSLESPNAPWPRFQIARLEHLALRSVYPVCPSESAVD
ncbi:DUF3080 family protein [Vreelandella sp. EE7]